MLDNYKVNQDGVIYQVETKPFDYNFKYANNYTAYDDSMSYLRLGHLIGAIGSIPNSILDVGYGSGSFLKVAAKIIDNCCGNDISNYSIPPGCTFVENILDDHYDVITFFDSLEHFPTIDWVEQLNCNHVVISLPNCHYFDDQWFEQWKHRKPDEHLWHFNESALLKFMSRMGYKPLYVGNVEDTIRKYQVGVSNILTGVFEKQ
jgi:SAM-dependent methyltransferase